MVFSSVPSYLDPHNWQQQQSEGGSANHQLPPPLPPPPPAGGDTANGGGPARPSSMAERARLAKLPQPEAAQKCPRCESTNTKFCYFNNYSLSQPRHFCKTCRRYWTRGGALRNVPVGGGCRRSSKRSKARSRSKSPATNNDHGIGHSVHPTPQFPILPSLPQLSDYGSGEIGLGFAGMQPPVAATGGASGGAETEFQIGGGPNGSGQLLSARFYQNFPFITGLEPPSGVYPFGGGGVDPMGYTGTSEIGSKPLDSGITQIPAVKNEENQGLNFSRNFLGILQGNDHQYWGGNAWTDLNGFTSSSTSHLL